MSNRRDLVLSLLSLLLLAGDVNAQDVEIVLGSRSRFPESFTGVSGVRPLRDGRVVVTDRADRKVGLIDAGFQSITRIGREGRGPGEFVAPGDLVALPGDSTAVLDLGVFRITILDPSGKATATVPMMGNSLFWPTGATASHWIAHNPEAAQAMRGGRLAVERIGRRSGRTDTAAMLNVPRELQEASRRQGWGPPTSAYYVHDAYAVAPDGWIAIARHAPYRVDWVAPDGKILVGAERRVPQIAITSADKEAWADRASKRTASISLDGGGGGRMRMPKPDISQVAFPSHFPPFSEGGVLVSHEGEAWVRRELPERTGRVEYDVFDRAGKLRGTVRLALGSRVVGFQNGNVLLVARDDDGLEWLERAPRSRP